MTFPPFTADDLMTADALWHGTSWHWGVDTSIMVTEFDRITVRLSRMEDAIMVTVSCLDASRRVEGQDVGAAIGVARSMVAAYARELLALAEGTWQ